MGTEAKRRHKSPVFYGWFIVAGHMAVHFYLGAVFIYGMSAFLGPMTSSMGWTRAQFSVAAGLQRLEGSVASPVVGFIVDRFGPRRVILAGGVLATAGLLLMSQVHTLWAFYGAYVVVALGMSSTIGIPFTAAAVNWFSRRRGRAMGIMFSGPIVSGPVVPLLVVAIQAWGWRTAMAVVALGTLLVVLPAGAAVRHRPEPYGYRPDNDDPPADEPDRPGSGAPPPTAVASLRVGEALSTRSFWVLTLIFGLTAMGPGAMFLHQIPYFESIGFSKATAATTFATFSVLSGLGRLGAGWLMDYVDRRAVVAGLVLLNVLGFLVLAGTTAYWHTVVYALLFGTAFGGMIPARPILTSALYGTRAFGAITGLMQSLAVVGGVAAPVVMGMVFDSTGSYKPAILAITALVALAIPLTALLPISKGAGARLART